MERYVGLDVSLKETSICVVDDDGKILCEGTVISEPEAIAEFIQMHAVDAKRIGLETGPTATWLWHDLRALGLPVICIDARHANANEVMAELRDHFFPQLLADHPGLTFSLQGEQREQRRQVQRRAWWQVGVGHRLELRDAAIFGPLPGSTTELAISALTMWLLVALGYWIDRHRGAEA